jgi:integrase/transposase-like protein
MNKTRTWQKSGRKSSDGKSDYLRNPPAQPLIKAHGMKDILSACPECASHRIWKDGFRRTRNGDVQRYICRECGYRFSETTWNRSDESDCVQKVHSKILCSFYSLSSNRQVSVIRPNGAKNLVKVESRIEEQAAGAAKFSKMDVKGKLVEYSWHLKKEGYADSTVKVRTRILKRLIKKGVDVMDPEAVKLFLASHDWSNQYRQNIVNCYQTFLNMIGLTWQPPSYQVIEELPFIPLEEEIDALISGCGKKVATTVQLLKETGMRIGEAWKLEWTDIDEKRRTIKCKPEKGGKPRMFKVSTKLIAMLKALPKRNQMVFSGTNLSGHRSNFSQQRRRLASKLQNPRLLEISFHTLRHWKATMEYHKTKDILHVKQLLGHRNINSTLIYTQLVAFENPEEYTSRVAKTLKEDQELIEAGFEYVTERD